MKVLVFGASGRLGTVLCQRLQATGHAVLRFTRSANQPCCSAAEMTASFAQTLEQVTPDCIINLVAATNVDQCERDMGHAALLNCIAPQILSRLCADGPQLIQISSDQVYCGSGPHREDVTQPINVYALTKLVGEYPVLQSGGCVLRTNFFGKSQTPGRSSFSDWLVQAGRTGQPINVFDDVWFNPLGLSSLSAAILRTMELRLRGLYNLGAASALSKAGFAKTLFERLSLDTALLRPSSVASARLGARRPNDMRMDCTRFTQATGFVLPTIEQEISHEATEYL
jgi:dTDP-4-dehydrorhamnose reductase